SHTWNVESVDGRVCACRRRRCGRLRAPVAEARASRIATRRHRARGGLGAEDVLRVVGEVPAVCSGRAGRTPARPGHLGCVRAAAPGGPAVRGPVRVSGSPTGRGAGAARRRAGRAPRRAARTGPTPPPGAGPWRPTGP